MASPEPARPGVASGEARVPALLQTPDSSLQTPSPPTQNRHPRENGDPSSTKAPGFARDLLSVSVRAGPCKSVPVQSPIRDHLILPPNRHPRENGDPSSTKTPSLARHLLSMPVPAPVRVRPCPCVSDPCSFGHCPFRSFEFVSDFVLRISDLVAVVPSGATECSPGRRPKAKPWANPTPIRTAPERERVRRNWSV
jgi:hypothetical protein